MSGRPVGANHQAAAWAGLSPPYACIVADPPWPQQGGGPLTGREGFGDATGASKPMPYPTMSVAGIEALAVARLAAPDAHLFLWATSGFLEDAFNVVRAWGFWYSTTLVWTKEPMGGGLGGAFGIATEFVLYARRGQPETLQRVGRNWFPWKRLYDERGKPMHSAKPPEFFQVVEMVCPGPYVELFARRERNGWDAWGNEVPTGVS